MRQSTLAFGQRPSPAAEKLAEVRAPKANGKQGDKRSSHVSSSQSTVVSSSTSSTASSSQAHPFFAKREREAKDDGASPAKDEEPASKVRRATLPEALKRKQIPQLEAPWPRIGESHVVPSSYEYPPTRVSLPSSMPKQSRERVPRVDIGEEHARWPWSNASTSVTSLEVGSTGMAKGVLLPLKEKLGSSTNTTDERRDQLWTEWSKPQCCEAVLGNERQARYLRDWLRVLQVTDGAASEMTREQKIIKRAQRRRAPMERGEMSDFLVGDTEEEEAWFDQFRAQEVEDLSFRSGDELDFGNAKRLANVIILVGPTGSGKTASVYACAEELGFEVFELFAGMGKRSGRDVVSLVGDLCRNHMVSSGGTGGGAFLKMQSFLKSQTKASSGDAGRSNTSKGKPRQSLVLVEEVDILFEDDRGFWSALIELAAESRRPIILTCNDLASIPLDDLPVQQVLHYSSPPIEIAVPYLHRISAEKGRPLSPHFIHAVYADVQRAKMGLEHDEMLIGRPKEFPQPDLRQALMQLQVALVSETKEDTQAGRKDAEESLSLRALVARTERCSAGYVIGRVSHKRNVERLEPDQYQASANDVLLPGATLLYKPVPRGDEDCLVEYGCEQDLCRALCGQREDFGLTLDYHARRRRIGQAINQLCERQHVVVQSRIIEEELLAEYAPWIHKMVSIDDAEEAAHEDHLASLLEEARRHDQAINGLDSSDGPSYASAAASLARAGIRPSRHSSRLLLQRDSGGLMQLGRREADFCRWLTFDKNSLDQARSLAPQFH